MFEYAGPQYDWKREKAESSWRDSSCHSNAHDIDRFCRCFFAGNFFRVNGLGFSRFKQLQWTFRDHDTFFVAKTTPANGGHLCSVLCFPMQFFGLFCCSAGFCAVSAPLILLVILLKGMGYGLLASALLGQYGASALRYLAISILPNLLVSGIALLFCCQESYRMSRSIWQMMQPQVRGSGEGSTAGEYGAKMILYGIFLCLGAALEAYLCAASIAGLIIT